MTLKEQVNKDFIQARKEKDILRANVLRLIKTEFDSFTLENRRDMTEAEEIHVFQRDIKKAREAMDFAQQAAREDLVEENQQKIRILEAYIPSMMTEGEVEIYLRDRGIAAMPMKDAMKTAMQELDGKADKKMVSGIVKRLVNS